MIFGSIMLNAAETNLHSCRHDGWGYDYNEGILSEACNAPGQ